MTDEEILIEWAARVVDAEQDRVLDEREQQLRTEAVELVQRLRELFTEHAAELQQLDPVTRRDLADWIHDIAEDLGQLIGRNEP